MDKNKIEQKKPDSNQKGVEEDSPLRLTEHVEQNPQSNRQQTSNDKTQPV